LFSDNVSIDDELELKQFAVEKNLLVMGPDCGTSLIGGVGIGFANVVRKGSIGVIGASGTGLQEFTSQVHNAGFGISHAIGTGSHDLSDKIGGLTTLAALDVLEADPKTKVITLISKPPGAKTLAKLSERLKTCKQPVVGCFLGIQNEIEAGTSFHRARLIDDAVRLSIAQIADKPVSSQEQFTPQELEWMSREIASWSSQQKYIRGLFAGGTFCYQSQQIFRDADILVYSNVPLDLKYKLDDPDHSIENTLVDMGDDLYTMSRPHPMIDGTMRKQRILSEGREPQVAVLLLDFILGFNVSMDLVGEQREAIMEAKQLAQKRGDALTVVASICGTDDDPQDLSLQTRMLKESGVIVFYSNAKAAHFCCALIRRR
jgi:succinyl-CoA synthetase alpha subunit